MLLGNSTEQAPAVGQRSMRQRLPLDSEIELAHAVSFLLLLCELCTLCTVHVYILWTTNKMMDSVNMLH